MYLLSCGSGLERKKKKKKNSTIRISMEDLRVMATRNNIHKYLLLSSGQKEG
jgi:hypothetical protein